MLQVLTLFLHIDWDEILVDVACVCPKLQNTFWTWSFTPIRIEFEMIAFYSVGVRFNPA